MQTENDVRSRWYQLSGIPLAVIVDAVAGDEAEVVGLSERWAAGRKRHIRTANMANGSFHVGQVAKPAVAGRRIPGAVARYVHPLVAVVHRRRFVLFESEAAVVYH